MVFNPREDLGPLRLEGVARIAEVGARMRGQVGGPADRAVAAVCLEDHGHKRHEAPTAIHFPFGARDTDCLDRPLDADVAGCRLAGLAHHRDFDVANFVEDEREVDVAVEFRHVECLVGHRPLAESAVTDRLHAAGFAELDNLDECTEPDVPRDHALNAVKRQADVEERVPQKVRPFVAEGLVKFVQLAVEVEVGRWGLGEAFGHRRDLRHPVPTVTAV